MNLRQQEPSSCLDRPLMVRRLALLRVRYSAMQSKTRTKSLGIAHCRGFRSVSNSTIEMWLAAIVREASIDPAREEKINISNTNSALAESPLWPCRPYRSPGLMSSLLDTLFSRRLIESSYCLHFNRTGVWLPLDLFKHSLAD